MRIFIGDVQGCQTELERLLEKVGFDPASDRLHFVGDLVNRGPSSAAVLRLARSLDAVCVLGNHEAALLAAGLCDPEPSHPGRFRDCQDLLEAPDRIQLGSWISTWPLICKLDDVVLVHAAVPPSLWDADQFATPTANERDFMLAARYSDPRGRRPASDWPPPQEPYRPWHSYYHGPWMIVFGHWARQGLLIGHRLRGLDTGCVYGGSLTAWIAEEDRTVQVPAERVHYPPSK